jgi:hypothetical protein
MKHHLLSWVLSVMTGSRHFRRTQLITDTPGARLLVDHLAIPFTEIRTDLDAFAAYDPAWFVLGKLASYRVLATPFVHLDSDVYLWDALPQRLRDADVLAQSYEPFRLGDPLYRPECIEFRLRSAGVQLPTPLDRHLPSGGVFTALNCGIVGGNRLDFLAEYAGSAVRLIENCAGRCVEWGGLSAVHRSIFIEQYFLSACLEHANAGHTPPGGPIGVAVLFPSTLDAYRMESSSLARYTHLLGVSKRRADLSSRLETLVKSQYPALYGRCCRCEDELGSLE